MEAKASKTIQLPQEKKGNIVVSHGLNGVLLLFLEEEWKKFDQWLLNHFPLTSKEGRYLSRFFRGSAVTYETEENGQWTISDECWRRFDGKSGTMEVLEVEEYLDMRKDNINQLERIVLEYVAFVIAMR